MFEFSCRLELKLFNSAHLKMNRPFTCHKAYRYERLTFKRTWNPVLLLSCQAVLTAVQNIYKVYFQLQPDKWK